MTMQRAIQPGKSFQMPGAQFTYRLAGQQSQGKQAQVEVTAEGQIFFAPPHTHLNEDESLYIIEGDCLVQNGKDIFEVGAGDSVFVPKGTPHAITNAGDTPARVLFTMTPAGKEPYFAEFAETFADVCPLPKTAFSYVDGYIEQTTPAAEASAKMATLRALWDKYGMQGARSA